MARTDKRLIKPKFPKTVIGDLLEESDKLKYDKIYNYEYSYYTKTNMGMRDDTTANHKYGNEREGYEEWSKDNPELSMSYSGVTSVREMYNRKTNEVVGYMFEKKLSNEPWVEVINQKLELAWQEFIRELDIKDTATVEYFLFNDIELDWRDSAQDKIAKFKIMLKTIERYNDVDEEEFKKFFDKLKG